MPRVHHVKKARKANKAAGIKKGDSYYWWKNRAPGSRSGFKRYSKTPPKPSQTTGNPFYAAVYSIQEAMAESVPETAEDLQGLLEGWAEEIRELAQEQDDKLDNMPDGLREGDTGQLLQERAEALHQWADDLENIDCVPDEDVTDFESWLDEKISELRDTDPGV